MSVSITRSKMFSRAAQPSVHRQRSRRLNAAARKVSAEPKVQRLLRAKCVNRVALDIQLSRHGRKSASAEFLRPCRDFSQYRSPLNYISAILKTFVEEKASPAFWEYGSLDCTGEESPNGAPHKMYILRGPREGGGLIFPRGT